MATTSGPTCFEIHSVYQNAKVLQNSQRKQFFAVKRGQKIISNWFLSYENDISLTPERKCNFHFSEIEHSLNLNWKITRLKRHKLWLDVPHVPHFFGDFLFSVKKSGVYRLQICSTSLRNQHGNYAKTISYIFIILKVVAFLMIFGYLRRGRVWE